MRITGPLRGVDPGAFWSSARAGLGARVAAGVAFAFVAAGLVEPREGVTPGDVCGMLDAALRRDRVG